MVSRVLILSASSGQGHVRAAQALEKAFAASGDACVVKHVDALQYASPIVRDIYSRAYINMVNKAPAVLGWLYDNTDKPWKNERRRLAFDRLNTLPLMKMIVDYEPDIVISTHFLPAEIVSWLLCRKQIQARHAVVVTDFDAHAMWLCRHCDDYFVALDETKQHLSGLGVNGQTITVSGIPIDPIFSHPKEKTAMRLKYGLDADRPTIIVSAGGFGVGPMERLLAALAHMRHRCQVIAMCGKNDALRSRLQAVAARSTDSRHLLLHPIPFTTDMDEYMAASDIVLGKPGGLTTAEALAKGLVYVVFNPIPGQEERNADHLLEEGAGIRCNNLPTLAYKLDNLLDDPRRLHSMQANALRLSHPMAAQEIAAKLLQLQAAAHQGTIVGSGHSCYAPPLGKTLETARRGLEQRRLTFMRTLSKQRKLNFRVAGFRVAGFRSKQ